MGALLKLSAAIDAVNRFIGRHVIWLILASVVVSAANAIVRKVFSTSSNAFLEVQWYLFAAAFLLAAAYVLQQDEHVRIDALSNRFSERTRAWIDVVGIIVFLIPLTLYVADLAWPHVWRSYTTGEMSQNAGGLIRWPVYALVPLGFGLLFLQAVSELVKRIAFLRGLRDRPTDKAEA